MDTLKLTIVTPNGEIFCDEVKSVVLPGNEGEFGVLPNHSSLVSELTVGVIEIEKKDASKDAVAINWGYVKITEDKVDVLAEGAVSLSKNGNSSMAERLKEATELVNSVKEANTPMAFVKSKINSYA